MNLKHETTLFISFAGANRAKTLNKEQNYAKLRPTIKQDIEPDQKAMIKKQRTSQWETNIFYQSLEYSAKQVSKDTCAACYNAKRHRHR